MRLAIPWLRKRREAARQAIRDEAAALIAEHGAKAWDVASERLWEARRSNDRAVDRLERVRREVERQLGMA